MNSPSSRHTPARAGAVVHRPPVTTAMPVTAPLTFSPNAALLIDFDNVTMGIRSDLQTELKNLLSSDIIKGKVQLRRAYADWRRYPQYVAPLAESSIDMIMAPAYGSSKKNATDIRLAIDALELVFTRPEIGTYILLSGDSDFSTLVIKLKEYGKYVIGVGIRESSSDLLVMNCDEYFSYNALAGLVRSDNEPVNGGVRRDPWELVSAALQRMQRNEDVMRADRLKQVMQDIDSSFDEKNLGMSKFSRFVQEAAQRGLLSLTKLENGQLEVAPPKGKPGEDGTAAAAASATAHPAPEARAEERGEDRARRSRRGGRGRGREGRGPRSSGPVGTASAPAAGETESELPLSAVAAHEHAPAPVAQEPHVAQGRGAHRAAPPTVVPPAREEGAAGANVVQGGLFGSTVVQGGLFEGPVIGQSGERLTRDEAFDLVRRAVASLVSGDDAVRASVARARAFELLGHDSESLSERNFTRILRDAHDADIVDLRRLGDDYEVAQAATATPVSEQLNTAAAAHAGAAASAARGGTTGSGRSATPAPPRGLGPRGSTQSRRSGLGGRSNAPPPELLTVGMVGIVPAAPTFHDAPSTTAHVVPAAAGDAEEIHGPPDSMDPLELAPAAPKRARARSKSGRVVAIAEPGEKKPRRPRGRAAPDASDA